MTQNRLLFTFLGALAALSFYAWSQVAQTQLLADRTIFMGITATGVFFAALLAIGLRISLPRAAIYAAIQAAVMAGLLFSTSLRFAALDDFVGAIYPFICVVVLTALPLPFFIAHASGNWRDYGMLFEEAWQIVARYVVGVIVVGGVWALLGLSDLLLSLVGLNFMAQLFDLEFPLFLVTGAAIGFGMAVAGESLAPQGAGLALMLLRPMLPPILGVVALFLLALPLRGLSELFGDLSAGGILLAIAAVAAMLISAVVDARGETASASGILTRSAQAMAVLMALLGILAAWAIFLRVQQYGWTPQRVIATMAALASLGYGAAYVTALLRADWMARIRSANVYLALGITGMAALLISPLVHVERIATASQMARFDDGRTAVADLDVLVFESWGNAGIAALVDLRERSKQPGQEALAVRLNNPYGGIIADDNARQKLLDEVTALIPLQPPIARDVQSILLQGLADDVLVDTAAACIRQTGDLALSCAMIVADFLPDLPGEEGLIALIGVGGDLQFHGVTQDDSQGQWARAALVGGGEAIVGADATDALRAWQNAPPELAPAPVNQIPLPKGGVTLMPNW